VPGYMHFPEGGEEPPDDSRFFRVERRDERDSPEMVYLWASAVLRQIGRYREALAAHARLGRLDRYDGYVGSDDFFDAWCVERAELHFLMEAAVQMYRWATVAHPTDRSWEARTPLYPGLVEAGNGGWVHTLRNALVHFDEAYRGGDRAQATVAKAERLDPDLKALTDAARHLLSEVEPPPYEPC
jgi:hypothetical protein